MKFAGFERSALQQLEHLPRLDAAGYARHREALNRGLIAPARALIGEVTLVLDAPLTRARGEVAGDALRRVPPPWTDEHPRAELLRKTGFQVRFRIPLPREVERPEFAPWCAEHLSELLPTHRWLVKHLVLGDDAG